MARNRFVSSRRRADVGGPRGPIRRAADCARRSRRRRDDPACRDLERALASLPDIHREVLLLVGVEGLDVAQAAAVLSIRPDAARQRLARARAALAEALGEHRQRGARVGTIIGRKATS